jgi:CRISPR-associated protein Csm1
VTVSAGVSVHHEKFPLYQAAEIAKEFLEAAKNFVHPDGHEKDALGFWGRVVDWDETQNWLRRWHDKLVEWLKGHQATRALLFKLARIAELHEELKRRLERKLRLSPAGN